MRRSRDSVALWQARWDKQLALTQTRKYAVQRSHHLQRFLESTGKTRLSEIDSVDLQDFLVVWGRTHTPGSVVAIRGEIVAFWKWLIEVQELPIERIAGKPKSWELRPDQARAILAGCDADYRVAQWMEGVFRREKRQVGMSYNRLLRRFKRSATKAGLPWITPAHFRHLLRRRKWGRELIAEHLAARAASPLRPEDYNLPYVQLHLPLREP